MTLLERICEDYKKNLSLEYICKKYGGTSIYIPKISPYAKENILKEFTGDNHIVLAHKYNLSESSVRKIVRRRKSK